MPTLNDIFRKSNVALYQNESLDLDHYYRQLDSRQKSDLLQFVSHTVSELRMLPCPEQFREILPYYLIKYNGKEAPMADDAVQLTFLDDSDVVIEDE